MIDVFPDRIDSNDRFLFYWSGHGVTRGRSGFLPVSDTPKGQYSKMISMDNIQQWNRYLKARQSLFLLDACFGGLAGVVPKSPTTELTINQLAQASHHLLTAGTDKEETIAGNWWGGSLFTAAVIDGLRGDADTESHFKRDGVVSLRELMVYVQKRVAVERDRVGWNGSLTPQLRDLRSSNGEFFFLTTQGKREAIAKQGAELSGASEFGEPIVKSSSRAMSELSRVRLQEAQEVLKTLGYQPGPIDGELGIRTRGAILKFQQDSGLAPTGQLDEPTLSQLALSWSSQAGTGQPKPKQVAVGMPPPPPSPSQRPSKISNSIGMEFVLIPAGTFTMGSPDSDPNADSDEKPPHQVTISEPFYMGKYEVTQAQWQAVMGTTLQEQRDKANKDWSLQGVGAKHPMYYVSWDEVQDFIKKLNAIGDRVSCRLPTEAQWEYAARAGEQHVYSFGNDAAKLGEYAWYSGNAGGTTHPVGQELPNAWGLYDMHGNVWEWVQDWYGPYEAKSVADPSGPDAGAIRVVRGGGWYDPARLARSAYRHRIHPGVRVNSLGFRCLSSVPSQ